MGASRKFSGWQKFGASVTFAIAVLGAVTGTISFVRQEQVRLRLIPGVYKPGERERAMQIGIVNGSSRGISIADGVVLFNGRSFARIKRVIPDARDLTDGTINDAQLASSATDLPFAIDAGGSFAGAVIWQVEDKAVLQSLRDKVDEIQEAQVRSYPLRYRRGAAAAREFAALRRKANVLKKRLKLTLRLDFEPGGTRSSDAQIKVDSVLEYPSSSWKVKVVLKRGVVKAMTITPPAQSVPVIGTLRLWRDDAATSIRRITRPVPASFDGGRTQFPLAHLPKGRYAWAVMVGTKIQDAGILATPCLQLTRATSLGMLVGKTSETVDAFTCSPGFLDLLSIPTVSVAPPRDRSPGRRP